VVLVEEHELAAGKLAALVARSTSRDIFDAREVLRRPDLDRTRLRFAFVLHGAMQQRLGLADWRTLSTENIRTTAGEVAAQLLPMLRFDVRPANAELEAWTENLVRDTRELMTALLPLEAHELEFLERLHGAGDIAPELLTADAAQRELLRTHTGLLWKAAEARQRLGAVGDAPEAEPSMRFQFHTVPGRSRGPTPR
jgi:hypothetical protein